MEGLLTIRQTFLYGKVQALILQNGIENEQLVVRRLLLGYTTLEGGFFTILIASTTHDMRPRHEHCRGHDRPCLCSEIVFCVVGQAK